MLAFVMVGCGPKYLERSGIPLIWGMRLDEGADEFELPDNLNFVSGKDSNELLIELPLRADSFGLPVVGQVPSAVSVGLLRDAGVPLSIAFATTNYKELFPTDDLPAPQIWFQYFKTALDSALFTFQGCKLKRLILAADWGLMAGEKEWDQVVSNLRSHHPNTTISFGGRTEALKNNHLAEISDEIAIDYAPIAGEELKGPCREENLKIAALAQEYHRPVFIFRANVIGENPALQIKNRLRFWHPEAKITGICLNTPYAKVAARDATTYYGMADDQEALDFIQEYRQRERF